MKNKLKRIAASVLTLVLNLILTGGFVVWVKKLALRTYAPEAQQ